MRRFVGLVPVLLLAVAVVVSAGIGLSLSHEQSARDVADQLGCRHVSSDQLQAGVDRETCLLHGDRVVILTLGQGSHVLVPPDLPNNFILWPAGRPWVIGCERRRDCVEIRHELGGELTSGPMIGLSLVIG